MPGIDACFKAPKNVGVLWAFGDRTRTRAGRPDAARHPDPVVTSWFLDIATCAMISAMQDLRDAGEKLIRVPIGFPAELHEWLRELAFRQRTTMAEIVREAVREYRDRRDPQLGLPLDPGSS